jgi:hypothetical protein
MMDKPQTIAYLGAHAGWLDMHGMAVEAEAVRSAVTLLTTVEPPKTAELDSSQLPHTEAETPAPSKRGSRK